MMQQLAAKQSDIAALDIGKGSAKGAPAAGDESPQTTFTDIIRQVSPKDSKGTKDAGSDEVGPNASVVSNKPVSKRVDNAETESKKNSEEDAKVPRVEVKRGREDATLPDKDPLEKTQPVPGESDSIEEWVQEQGTDIDWLAYVDAVQSADQKLTEQDVAVPNEGELSDEQVSLSKALLALKEIDTEQPEGGRYVTVVDDAGKASITPVEPVIEQLVTQLNQAQTSDGTQQQELKAMAGVLLTLQQEGKISLNSDSILAKLADALPGLEAKAANGDAQTGELISKVLAEANAESGDAQQGDSEQSLLLSLIQNELNAARTANDESAGADSKKLAQKMNPENALVTPEKAENSLMQLMEDMQQLSQSSQEDMTEALSSKIVALMPNASAEQQQAVKSALTSGINEIQQQLAKGHEPGIDLKSVIQQAIAEANVNQPQAVMAQIEQQATQLHQVVSAAQQTMQHVLTSQMVSADTVIQENSQIRSEAGKGQQSADAIDNKPVNITRAEGQQQLQEKIRWMVNSRSTLAEIRLDPPELGSMQVRVNMSGDAASVSFVVQSQQAKDALSDAMPRLREMLNEQGIELGESFVQQEQNGDGAEQQTGNGNGQYAGNAEDDGDVREQPLTRQETGGIDYYV